MTDLKTWIKIAVVLLVIGGLGSLITFVTMDQNNIQKNVEVDPARISGLEVRLRNGLILMQETDDDHIRIRLTGKERIKSDVDLLVEEIGNVLSIEAKRTKRTLFNKMAVRDLTLTIDVPKKVFESIRMEIYNGKLKANQLYATHVNAEADNAEIRLEAVEAEHVMVATNNGTIVLAHVTGDVTGETKNGSIHMLTQNLDYNLDLKTINGSIEIETDQEPANAFLDLRVRNGRTHVFGDPDWPSVYGNGEHLIKLRTENGSITIKKSSER